MRVAALSLLLFAAVASTAFADDFDCGECKAKIDLARDCMDTGCLTGTDTDRDNCLLTSSGITTFMSCCGWQSGDTCYTRVEEAVDCVDGTCIDTCVLSTVFAYATCLNNDSSCSQTSCLDIIEDAGDEASTEVDLTLDNNAVGSTFFNCDVAEADAEEYCDDGEQCCPGCQNELGLLLDCVYNKVLVPWLENEQNVQNLEDGCSIKQECGVTRLLQEETNGDELSEEDLAVFTQCGEKLTLQMVAGNATDGVGEFMNCTLSNAVSDLPEESTMEDTSMNGEETSSGVVATGALAVLSAAAALAVAAM